MTLGFGHPDTLEYSIPPKTRRALQDYYYYRRPLDLCYKKWNPVDGSFRLNTGSVPKPRTTRMTISTSVHVGNRRKTTGRAPQLRHPPRCHHTMAKKEEHTSLDRRITCSSRFLFNQMLTTAVIAGNY